MSQIYTDPVRMTINIDGCELHISQPPTFEVTHDILKVPGRTGTVQAHPNAQNYLGIAYDVLTVAHGSVDRHGDRHSGDVEWTFRAPDKVQFAGHIRPGHKPKLWCSVYLSLGTEYNGLESLDIHTSRESFVTATNVRSFLCCSSLCE